MKRIFLAAALFAGGSVLACDVPDEGGNITWRRVVAKVRYQPSVEAWAIERAKAGGAVQYVVELDSPRRESGRCWWPVEVRADGQLWRRYFVTPDAKVVRRERGDSGTAR